MGRCRGKVAKSDRSGSLPPLTAAGFALRFCRPVGLVPAVIGFSMPAHYLSGRVIHE